MTLPSLANHQLLVLWVELAALLGLARVLGRLSQWAGQPAVVGELVAGLLLGPSVFGHVWPGGFRWFLPAGPSSVPLAAVSALCLLFVLMVIGAETDLKLIRSLGRPAASVSAASLLLPLGAGGLVAAFLPGSLVGSHGGRSAFALLLAGAVAVSSLPVVARIVGDLGLLRRDVGQLALAAGTVNDAAGFLVLAVATGLAGSGGAGHLAIAVAGLLGISILVLTAGQRAFDALLRRARLEGPSVVASLGVCVTGSLAAAAAMQAVGVEGALGSFVAGVALGRSRFQQERALSVLDTTTTTVFSPLYFATAGLRVDVEALVKPGIAVSLGVVTAVAAASKLAGAAAGARLAHLHRREATALGIVLNGRGALQVILATVGLGVGIFDNASYTVVIIMSLITSIAVPPALRAAIKGWRGSPQEQERLGREEELGRNVVVRGRRLLVPSRGSANSIVAAEVLALAWPPECEATVLSIGTAGEEGRVSPVIDVLSPRRVEHRHVASKDVLDEILAEAKLGYGVIGLGAAEQPSPHHLLSAVLDDLLTESPIPLLVVRRARGLGSPLPPAFSKVLVPVNGTVSARAGQEVACNLGRSLGTQLMLMHVVTRGDTPSSPPPLQRVDQDPPRGRGLPQPDAAAQVVLRGALAMAEEMGLTAEIGVRRGASAGDEILSAATEMAVDAIVLGTVVRELEGHPFLGHTVEQVLAHATPTVITVVLPARHADPASLDR